MTNKQENLTERIEKEFGVKFEGRLMGYVIKALFKTLPEVMIPAYGDLKLYRIFKLQQEIVDELLTGDNKKLRKKDKIAHWMFYGLCVFGKYYFYFYLLNC